MIHLDQTLMSNPPGIQDKGGEEHLYVTYMVQPHIVFEVLPGGEAVHRWAVKGRGFLTQAAGK